MFNKNYIFRFRKLQLKLGFKQNANSSHLDDTSVAFPLPLLVFSSFGQYILPIYLSQPKHWQLYTAGSLRQCASFPAASECVGKTAVTKRQFLMSWEWEPTEHTSAWYEQPKMMENIFGKSGGYFEHIFSLTALLFDTIVQDLCPILQPATWGWMRCFGFRFEEFSCHPSLCTYSP